MTSLHEALRELEEAKGRLQAKLAAGRLFPDEERRAKNTLAYLANEIARLRAFNNALETLKLSLSAQQQEDKSNE